MLSVASNIPAQPNNPSLEAQHHSSTPPFPTLQSGLMYQHWCGGGQTYEENTLQTPNWNGAVVFKFQLLGGGHFDAWNDNQNWCMFV